MLILFDQDTPLPIAKSLLGHSIKTARQRDWDTLTNGELLRVAEEAVATGAVAVPGGRVLGSSRTWGSDAGEGARPTLERRGGKVEARLLRPVTGLGGFEQLLEILRVEVHGDREFRVALLHVDAVKQHQQLRLLLGN